MREVIYYTRDEQNRPIGTTCILINDDGKPLARGIAICGKKDQPWKKRGRTIASERARKGLSLQEKYFPGKFDGNKKMKCEAAPILDVFEQKIVDRVVKGLKKERVA